MVDDIEGDAASAGGTPTRDSVASSDAVSSVAKKPAKKAKKPAKKAKKPAKKAKKPAKKTATADGGESASDGAAPAMRAKKAKKPSRRETKPSASSTEDSTAAPRAETTEAQPTDQGKGEGSGRGVSYGRRPRRGGPDLVQAGELKTPSAPASQPVERETPAPAKSDKPGGQDETDTHQEGQGDRQGRRRRGRRGRSNRLSSRDRPDSRSEPSQPEAGQPSSQPEAGQPSSQPEAGQPSSQPEAGQPSSQSEASEPEATPSAGKQTSKTRPDSRTANRGRPDSRSGGSQTSSRGRSDHRPASKAQKPSPSKNVPASEESEPLTIEQMLSEEWTEEKARNFLKQGFLVKLTPDIMGSATGDDANSPDLAQPLRTIRRVLADECMVQDDATDVMLLDLVVKALSDWIQVYRITPKEGELDEIERLMDIRSKADRRLMDAITALKNS